MSTSLRYTATCPKGMEGLLAEELETLGAEHVRESRAAVTFTGPMPVGYRVCLWSRLASRVLLVLADFPAVTAEELYAGAADVPWEHHLSAEGTLAVDAVGSTAAIVHSGFAALKVKDAVVDRIRRHAGRRPSVDVARPDLRLNLRLHRDRATLSVDLSGEPLHRRGYRPPKEQTAAPLKENLAAAILVRAGWPAIARTGGPLLDPLCGSGTLLVEAALMAADQAPGLLRRQWGFLGWRGHDPTIWNGLLAEADERAEAGRTCLPFIAGSDVDAAAVELARTCLGRAGFARHVTAAVADLAVFTPPPGVSPGLVVTNPPHGIRLGRPAQLVEIYALLGRRLLEGFTSWEAAIFTPEPELARATGLRARRLYTLYSGAVESKLYLFSIAPENVLHSHGARTIELSTSNTGGRSPHAVRGPERRAAPAVAAPAEMFANRLRKNLRHLGKWARREGITCYRAYDADLPEYAVAVDLYTGTGPDEDRRFAHVQEYAPPATVDPDRAAERLAGALAAIPEVLEVAPGDVTLKVRRRQRGAAQYDRKATQGRFVEVAEDGLRFLVNLTDYLDTGLFLDHRPIRARLREWAKDRRFLNLFAYTGSASVYAAAGGARSVTTVDMSATYVEWAKRNMELNGFPDSRSNRFVCADALTWLGEERARIASGRTRPYDLVFVDPPTFSNSARMGERTFSVERDHPRLLRETASLLSKDGVLVFSTNHRRFRLDADSLGELLVEDITRETIPPDFARNPRIHSCFIVRPPGGGAGTAREGTAGDSRAGRR